MHYLSKRLSNNPEALKYWQVTPTTITLLLSQSLQTRTWDGELLWQVDTDDDSWGLTVADNSVFLGQGTGAVMEFDLVSGTLTHIYHGHTSAIRLVSTARRPQDSSLLVLSASVDNTLQVYEHSTKKHLSTLNTTTTTTMHSPWIYTVEQSKQEDIILITTGGPAVILWDLSTLQPIRMYKGNEGTRFYASVLTGDDTFAAGALLG